MELARRAPRHPATGNVHVIGSVPVTGNIPATEALEFVRFCYGRRRIGWPELYDEMCAVAGRRLYQGWGVAELGAVGIGFALYEMPGLAALAAHVIAEQNGASRERDSAVGRGDAAQRPPRTGPAVEPPDPSAEVRAPMRLLPGAV